MVPWNKVSIDKQSKVRKGWVFLLAGFLFSFSKMMVVYLLRQLFIVNCKPIFIRGRPNVVISDNGHNLLG